MTIMYRIKFEMLNHSNNSFFSILNIQILFCDMSSFYLFFFQFNLLCSFVQFGWQKTIFLHFQKISGNGNVLANIFFLLDDDDNNIEHVDQFCFFFANFSRCNCNCVLKIYKFFRERKKKQNQTNIIRKSLVVVNDSSYLICIKILDNKT